MGVLSLARLADGAVTFDVIYDDATLLATLLQYQNATGQQAHLLVVDLALGQNVVDAVLPAPCPPTQFPPPPGMPGLQFSRNSNGDVITPGLNIAVRWPV